MIELGRDNWQERYLSRRWNNALTVALAIPMVAYSVAVLSTSLLSDRAAFIGMVLIGAVY